MAGSTSVATTLPALLPVLDLCGGEVVAGIAGERNNYQPLTSPLAEGSDPLTIARAIRKHVGHDFLYVADLDAIQIDRPDWWTLQKLAEDGCRLLVDAGLRDAARAMRLVDAGVTAVVAALETLPDPQVLSAIVKAVGPRRTIFSLDLKAGCVLGDIKVWETNDPLNVAQQAVTAGVGGMIVLDLAGVGVNEGVPTRNLCRQLRTAHPDLPLITGGGVRHSDDVRQLLDKGVNSVLIASALHSGRLHPREIVEWQQ